MQETTDLIAKSLEYNETESESEKAESERANSPPIPDMSMIESKPECSIVPELSSSTSEVDSMLPVEENKPLEGQLQVPQEKSNDEQSIGGSSKRIKKKRKFFDEFEETEQHECKSKLHVKLLFLLELPKFTILTVIYKLQNNIYRKNATKRQKLIPV